MRYHSYLHTAKKIIESYTGAEPLSALLKKFFVADKKYGSKDRKQLASLCYNYYRLGKALKDIPVEERIIVATFLCEQCPNDFLQFHKAEWNDKIAASTAEKLLIINLPARLRVAAMAEQGRPAAYQLLIDDIFPWPTELSEGIDQHQFIESFLRQPGLFLRIRPGKKDIVKKKLNEAGFIFEMWNDDCIALPNASKLDGVIEPDATIVIQDYNSQQVLNFLKDRVSGIRHPASVWDCCAASGGKSILAYDILRGKIELTVSDIRESILANLKKRFTAAGIKNYHSFIADLSKPDTERLTKNYQLIICDAPCTGSGTWSRTPEQLYYFKPATITLFAERQKKMVFHAIPHLEKNGLFFYITCSVFKKENEAIVDFIKEKFHLQLLQMEFLKGYDKKADSMFVAVFGNI